MSWYLIVALICILSMTTEVEYLSLKAFSRYNFEVNAIKLTCFKHTMQIRSLFMELRSNHHNFISEYIHHLQKKPWVKVPFPPSQPQATADLFFVLRICLFWRFQVNESQCVVFGAWLPSPGVMFLIFIHVIACINTLFLFAAE